jgi:hypothetical protein
MEAIAVACAAVAALFGIAIWGWTVALEVKKRNGALEREVELLKEDRLARLAQDASFDRSRGGDMGGDREFLPDPT